LIGVSLDHLRSILVLLKRIPPNYKPVEKKEVEIKRKLSIELPDDFEIESPSKRRRFSTIVKIEEIKAQNPMEKLFGKEFTLG